MLPSCLALATLATSLLLDANDWIPLDPVAVRHGPVPVYEVGHSTQATQDVDAFVLALSAPLRRWSSQTGFEACFQVCRSDTHLGALITSNGAKAACQRVPGCPAGMTPTPITGHSHPPDVWVRPNVIDRQFLGPWAVRRSLGVLITTPELPSPDDRRAGGYLITPSAVWASEGPGSVWHRVGESP